MKTIWQTYKCCIILCFVVFFTVSQVKAQLPFIDKLTSVPEKVDSIATSDLITLENVNTELSYTDNLLLKRNINEYNNTEQVLLIHKVDSFDVFIEKQGKEFKTYSSDKVWRFYLVNARINWKDYLDRLKELQREIRKEITELQNNQQFYSSNLSKWNQSLPELEKELSPQILSYIKANQEKLKKINDFYKKRILDLISAENKLVQNIVYVDGILDEINGLILKRKSELLVKNEPDIFSTHYKNSYSGSFLSRIELAFRENTKNFGYFLDILRNSLISYVLIFALLIAYFLFLRKKYLSLNISEKVLEGSKLVNRIIVIRPSLTMIFLIVILWNVFTPYTPFIFSMLLYLLAIIILYFLLAPVVSKLVKNVTFIIIILLIIINFEIFAWYYGNYSRLYLLFESAIGILLSYRFLLPSEKLRNLLNQDKKIIKYTRAIAITVFILSVVAFIANILGFENLTGYNNKLGVFTGLISVLTFGFYLVTYKITEASVLVLEFYYPELVSRYGHNILKRTKQILKVIVIFFWVSAILHISETWDLFYSEVVSVLTYKIYFGSLSLTPGKLLFFLLVLYLTYVIATFTKRILEREILTRHKLKRGLAASISLTLRIFIVFFGTLIAFSVSGMDLGKISIIAGALSVGIGFGLQNIVSNFISGLILIYEKPVMEGDTVEVDNLMGRVSNIGIRSSTLSTYDGAEVVVPNSNLISHQLINWTLSDNKKRVEIKIGTSYDSDPNKVLELLLKSAVSHEKVLTDPKPNAFFIGFGDSSLNFRLLFWVRFEDGLQTQSDVAISIFNLLKENKIEIPFPQVDLHIKKAE